MYSARNLKATDSFKLFCSSLTLFPISIVHSFLPFLFFPPLIFLSFSLFFCLSFSLSYKSSLFLSPILILNAPTLSLTIPSLPPCYFFHSLPCAICVRRNACASMNVCIISSCETLFVYINACGSMHICIY